MSTQCSLTLPRAETPSAGTVRNSICAGPAVRAIVFDVPDVLYDATLWRRWLWRLVSPFGVTASYADFAHAWDAGYLLDVHCGRREFTEAFESFLLAMGLSWGQIAEVEAASRAQADFDLRARPLPGIVRALTRLAEAAVPLVAWADLPQSARQLAEFLDRLGVGGCFQTVLSSLDCECAQPAPRCYDLMIDALQLPETEVLYVGHDGQHLAAASQRGLRTAAINCDPATQADVYLAGAEDLFQLPGLAPVASLCRRPTPTTWGLHR